MNGMNMGSMNHNENVIPIDKSIDEIGKEVTQEQIKFISTGKASPDFVVKFIKNRISEKEQENTKVDEYLKNLSMESLILLVKFINGQRSVSMESIHEFIERQLKLDNDIKKAA